MDLPAGAVLIPQLSSVFCVSDPGGTVTMDVGTPKLEAEPGFAEVAADLDRFADGIVLSSGGLVNFCSTGVPDAVATPFRSKRQVRVIATVATLTSGTAADLVFTIAYRVKG